MAKADILLEESTVAQVAMWQMNGNQIAVEPRPSATLPTAGISKEPADFNGDGKADILLPQ